MAEDAALARGSGPSAPPARRLVASALAGLRGRARAPRRPSRGARAPRRKRAALAAARPSCAACAGTRARPSRPSSSSAWSASAAATAATTTTASASARAAAARARARPRRAAAAARARRRADRAAGGRAPRRAGARRERERGGGAREVETHTRAGPFATALGWSPRARPPRPRRPRRGRAASASARATSRTAAPPGGRGARAPRSGGGRASVTPPRPTSRARARREDALLALAQPVPAHAPAAAERDLPAPAPREQPVGAGAHAQARRRGDARGARRHEHAIRRDGRAVVVAIVVVVVVVVVVTIVVLLLFLLGIVLDGVVRGRRDDHVAVARELDRRRELAARGHQPLQPGRAVGAAARARARAARGRAARAAGARGRRRRAPPAASAPPAGSARSSTLDERIRVGSARIDSPGASATRSRGVALPLSTSISLEARPTTSTRGNTQRIFMGQVAGPRESDEPTSGHGTHTLNLDALMTPESEESESEESFRFLKKRARHSVTQGGCRPNFISPSPSVAISFPAQARHSGSAGLLRWRTRTGTVPEPSATTIPPKVRLPRLVRLRRTSSRRSIRRLALCSSPRRSLIRRRPLRRSSSRRSSIRRLAPRSSSPLRRSSPRRSSIRRLALRRARAEVRYGDWRSARGGRAGGDGDAADCHHHRRDSRDREAQRSVHDGPVGVRPRHAPAAERLAYQVLQRTRVHAAYRRVPPRPNPADDS